MNWSKFESAMKSCSSKSKRFIDSAYSSIIFRFFSSSIVGFMKKLNTEGSENTLSIFSTSALVASSVLFDLAKSAKAKTSGVAVEDWEAACEGEGEGFGEGCGDG
ncbi:hypothetical protein F8388_024196, partial [Cannabis sativa]